MQSISKANDETVIDGNDDVTDKLSTKKKKKRSAKGNPDVGKSGDVDLRDKYLQTKALMRNKESEFIDVDKTNKDPYQYINKKTHKILINPVVPYRSTSMDDVYEIRNELLIC